jgi:hypothetical protein
MNSASLCSLAGRYDNPIPPRFLSPIDCLKIPAQATEADRIDSLVSIPGLIKSLKIPPLFQLLPRPNACCLALYIVQCRNVGHFSVHTTRTLVMQPETSSQTGFLRPAFYLSIPIWHRRRERKLRGDLREKKVGQIDSPARLLCLFQMYSF